MPTFPSNPFRSSRNTSNNALPLTERIGVFYRRKAASNPFLFFGLPFISLMVLSSFLLTPATALRYENHDRRTREVSTNEALSMGLSGNSGLGEAAGNAGVIYNPRRRVVMKGQMNEKDEYYVSFQIGDVVREICGSMLTGVLLCRDSWPRILTVGSRREWRGGRENQTGDCDFV